MITIDKNIPAPNGKSSKSEAVRQFAKMKVGHSFALPYVEDSDKRHANSIRCAFYNYCKKVEWQMMSQSQDGVLRVWRTA